MQLIEKANVNLKRSTTLTMNKQLKYKVEIPPLNS